MIKDYYQTLEIPVTSDQNEICKAFKTLSLKWHPERNPENKRERYLKFCEICESFEVLSSPIYKAIYDQHGIKNLK